MYLCSANGTYWNLVGLGWPQFGGLVSFAWPLTFLQQVGSRSHRAKGTEMSRILIETIMNPSTMSSIFRVRRLSETSYDPWLSIHT